MAGMWKQAGTLIVGVGLLVAGLSDALWRQRLGLPLDLTIAVAGAGALGVHVNL